MSLILEIVGPQAVQLGAAARKTFANQGGSIGRANVNDWVIPDAYVSGQHARVHFLEGRYFLEDVSTNGVFIKNPGNRLPKGQRYPLQTGDRVFIDAYEIKVTIEGSAESSNAPVPVESPPDSASLQHSLVRTAAIEKPRDFSNSLADNNNGFQIESTIPLPEPSDALADAIASANNPIDFDPFGETPDLDDAPPPISLPPLSPKNSPARASGALPIAPREGFEPVNADVGASKPDLPADLQEWLVASGIPESSITPELSENFGKILQVVIAGMMDLLRERQHVKQEFGIRSTTYKKADNNPLKFSVNIEDALHNLLVKRNAAYLGPVDAFQDAFSDMRNHETAMFQAMRAAFTSMLQSFSPESLQVGFNKGVKPGSLWSGPIKLRYWELYRERYKEVTRNPDQCFRDLFADEFVKEYSAQLERLRRRGGF